MGLPSPDSPSEFANTRVGLGAQLSTCTALVFQGYPENGQGIASAIAPHECISKGRLCSFSARETHSPKALMLFQGYTGDSSFLKKICIGGVFLCAQQEFEITGGYPSGTREAALTAFLSSI